MTDIVPYKADDNADDKLKETFEIVILGTCISNSAFVAPYYQKYGMSDERLYSHGLLHGGNGALQAIVAARMGAKVALITRKCSDDLTQMCLSALRIAGVSTKYVVPCYDRDITDENTLTCECGFKQPDAPYLTAEDVRKFAPIISSAKVVIVHYEIGYSAAYEALKLCKDTVSILFASPLPNVNAKHLFSMTQFVIFDGDNDLQVHYKFKTWLYPNERRSSPDCRETAENRVSILYASPLPNLNAEHLFQMATFILFDGKKDLEVQFSYDKWQHGVITSDYSQDADDKIKQDKQNAIANLLRRSLNIGARNVIVICNSIYTVYAGCGYRSEPSETNSIKWLSHSKPVVTPESSNDSAAPESVVSLAYSLVQSFLSDRNVSLDLIIDYNSKFVQFFDDHVREKKCLSALEISKQIPKCLDRNIEAPYKHFDLD